jgi:hypothetical protein
VSFTPPWFVSNVTLFYQFHVNLFAREDAAPFTVTWEDAAAMLERLPRMLFELDGSFVFSGSVTRVDSERAGSSSTPAQQDLRWQVDGHLFDFDGRLYRLELRGQCPPTIFDELLRCVGWPAQSLAFEMVREGVRLDEAGFRQQALDLTRTGGGDAPAR